MGRDVSPSLFNLCMDGMVIQLNGKVTGGVAALRSSMFGKFAGCWKIAVE